jgi:hypothetical protein
MTHELDTLPFELHAQHRREKLVTAGIMPKCQCAYPDSSDVNSIKNKASEKPALRSLAWKYRRCIC